MVTAHEILGYIEPIQILTTLGAAVNFGQQLFTAIGGVD